MFVSGLLPVPLPTHSVALVPDAHANGERHKSFARLDEFLAMMMFHLCHKTKNVYCVRK